MKHITDNMCHWHGNFLGYFHSLEQFLTRHPNGGVPGNSFINGTTCSLWVWDEVERKWVDSNRVPGPLAGVVDDPATFWPDAKPGVKSAYLYAAARAGNYVFAHFGSVDGPGLAVEVEVASIVMLYWDGERWESLAIPLDPHLDEVIKRLDELIACMERVGDEEKAESEDGTVWGKMKSLAEQLRKSLNEAKSYTDEKVWELQDETDRKLDRVVTMPEYNKEEQAPVGGILVHSGGTSSTRATNSGTTLNSLLTQLAQLKQLEESIQVWLSQYVPKRDTHGISIQSDEGDIDIIAQEKNVNIIGERGVNVTVGTGKIAFPEKSGTVALTSDIPKDFPKVDDFARQKGTYPDMAVGSAANLEGDVDIVRSAMYSPTGGDMDIAYDAASINAVRGNAVAWNQLIVPFDWETKRQNGVDFTYKDGVLTVVGTPTVNDTIYFHINSVVKDHIYMIYTGLTANTSQYQVWTQSNESLDGKEYFHIKDGTRIKATVTRDDARLRLILYSGNDINQRFTLQCFDLTLIYGAGNEPATAAQFEADYLRWFGRSLGYEPYDAGSVRRVLATAIKTTGFNQYRGGDFEGDVTVWQNKILYTNDVNYPGQFCVSADFENTPSSDKPANANFRAIYTDGTTGHGSINTANNSYHYEWKTDASKTVKYILGTYGFPGKTKVSNICVNFSWSGRRDGEYEPYWEETKALPLTTLRGRLNGEGSSVVVFPDGMLRAGDVCDEIKVENGVTKAIKRVREMRIEGGELVSSLYDEPQEYVVDDFELPVVYRIDDFGTERIVSPEGSVAPMLVTRYGVNAVDTLRRLPVNYISARSDDDFLAKLSAATGCVWSKSWSDERGCWVYAVEGELPTYGNATQSEAGLMSADDKIKVDGIKSCALGYIEFASNLDRFIVTAPDTDRKILCRAIKDALNNDVGKEHIRINVQYSTNKTGDYTYTSQLLNYEWNGSEAVFSFIVTLGYKSYLLTVSASESQWEFGSIMCLSGSEFSLY